MRTASYMLLIAVALLLPTLAMSAPPTPLGETAMLVAAANEPELDSALASALESTDPAVRAVAARVATVRGRSQLLPLIEPLLRTETNVEVARELIRAAIILGGTTGEINAAIETSKRFEHRLDPAVSVAVARLGKDAALPAYEKELAALQTAPESNFFRIALWGSVGSVPAAASRLLARNDEKGWKALMQALEESELVINASNLEAALNHPSATIRTATIESLINLRAEGRAFPAPANGVIAKSAAPAGDDVEISFKWELLRRVAGAEPQQADAWLEWISGQAGSKYLNTHQPLLPLLSSAERAAVRRSKKPVPIRTPPENVLPPQFYTPDVLPQGAADAIMATTGCRAGWIGLGEVGVDGAGRVTSLDLSNVSADSNCRRALEAMTRLSLLNPTSIRSEFETKSAVFIQPAKSSLCIDEARVPTAGELSLEACTPFTVGESGCKAPKVLKRVNPQFPLGRVVSGGRQTVVIEALITESGCVRSARLISQSPDPEINSSALLALLQWRFEPGTLGGVPVPMIFNLTVSFSRP